MSKTPYDYYTEVIGKGYDTDGYGYQCVAGFKHWCKEMLGLNFYNKSICYGNPHNGYACRIWYNYKSLGLDKYFDKVSPNQMVDGDWAIWEYGSPACPYSHIAMFRKDNGNGTGVFLGQNQTKNAVYSQVNITYNGLLGALRPKCYHNEKPQPVADQYLYPNSKVIFDGIFKVDILKSPLSSNLFGCTKLTNVSFENYRKENCKSYHWIPLGDWTIVDKNGYRLQNQTAIGGKSYVKNDSVYRVLEIDIPTNSAKIKMNGRNVWVKSNCLYEVSNS